MINNIIKKFIFINIICYMLIKDCNLVFFNLIWFNMEVGKIVMLVWYGVGNGSMMYGVIVVFDKNKIKLFRK